MFAASEIGGKNCTPPRFNIPTPRSVSGEENASSTDDSPAVATTTRTGTLGVLVSRPRIVIMPTLTDGAAEFESKM